MPTSATVFVVDDDPNARESVCALVESLGLAAESFASAEEFLDGYANNDHGCVVTDVRMLGMTGLELQQALKERGILLPVIVITAFAETQLTVQAIKQGAVTVLEKPYTDNDLSTAIREAVRRNEAERAQRQRRLEIRRRLASLTDKEREVLDRIIEGVANKVIARRLGVSVRTVENRRHQVYAKMQADSLAELVQMVIEVKDEG